MGCLWRSALGKRTVRNWSAKFKDNDFSIKHQKRSGRPSTRDDDQIKQISRDIKNFKNHHSLVFCEV